jgi:hypothetical protein
MAYLARGTTLLTLKPPGTLELTLSCTATSNGSTTTLVDATRLTQVSTDFWAGATITFTGGANTSGTKIVTAFNTTTDTITWVGAVNSTLTGDTFTITIPARPGPSKIRVYSVAVGGSTTAATTSLLFKIQDQLATPTVLAWTIFNTPTAINSAGGVQMYGPHGVQLEAPGGISITTAFGGAGSVLSTEIVYDFV